MAKKCTSYRHRSENVEEVIVWSRNWGNTAQKSPIGLHFSQQFPNCPGVHVEDMLDVVAMQVSSSPSVRQGNWQCKKRNLQCKKRKQQVHFTQNQIKIQQCLSPKTYPPAKTRARQSLEPSRQALTVALLAGWSALLAHVTFTACSKLVMRGHILPQHRRWLPATTQRIPRPHAGWASCPQPSPSTLLKSMTWICLPPRLETD